MRLVVGLGNPGPKHQNQRHNIGFMAADEIVRRHGLSLPRARFQGDMSEGEIAGDKILVLKPMTFMNESGRAVGEAVRFYKLAVEDVFVIYDELDLAAAKLRVKQGGGNAGHNGMRSIDAHLSDT
ncbi:MAG: aminoacyl-tRNA hydrolase, partial [Alphaproteobacteria bacterium]